MILAAIPISSKLKVDDLYGLMIQVLDGLIEKGVAVASVSCDGTKTERGVQHRFVKECAEEDGGQHTYTFHHPDGVSVPLEIRVPVYRGQAIVMLQDSKHLAKTFRNNALSGARSLTFGNTPPCLWTL
jgi:hypothetical protein